MLDRFGKNIPVTMIERNNALAEQDTRNYQQQVALNSREDRRMREYMAQKTVVVRLLAPVRISGPVRPVGTVIDILARDAERLIAEGKATACEYD